MFARQMAVMKGQAWNVVETLKTPDHGPLELTRRARVCVWDDLVDVPVAVPMRTASAEMRQRANAHSDSAATATPATVTNRNDGGKKASSDVVATAAGEGGLGESGEEEEMDIGAHATSTPSSAVVDLLGITTPPADLPHPGRFELAMTDEPPPSTSSIVSNGTTTPTQSQPQLQPPDGGSSTPRPHLGRAPPSSGHRSLNLYAPHRGAADSQQQQHSSMAAQMHAAGSSSSGGGGGGGGYYHYDDEDDDDLEGGDLGYAAATGMEGNRRKVIVERLEMVKSRNPVFTWC